jgi:hypothetical protein
VLFLASGTAEQGVIRNILLQDNPDGLLEGLVRSAAGICTLFLDQDAASQLPQR